MHEEARRFCSQYGNLATGQALDIGGRDVNGHVRDLWPNMTWTILDKEPPNFIGEYICADATTWHSSIQYDLIICTEVFEHEVHWRNICDTAFEALNNDSWFIVTCAGPDRSAHSAIDGGELRDTEYYGNIEPYILALNLARSKFRPVMVSYDPHACDTYAYALKP